VVFGAFGFSVGDLSAVLWTWYRLERPEKAPAAACGLACPVTGLCVCFGLVPWLDEASRACVRIIPYLISRFSEGWVRADWLFPP